MASTSSPVVSADCRKDPSSTTVVDETSLPSTETTDQKPEPEPQTSGLSGKAAKESSTSKKQKKRRHHAKKKPRKKETPSDDSDSSSSEDETGKSSDSDAGRERRNRRPRSSKKRTQANRANPAAGAKAKHARRGNKKPKKPISDSESESDASSSEGGGKDKASGVSPAAAVAISKVLQQHMVLLQNMQQQLQNKLILPQGDGQLCSPTSSYPNNVGVQTQAPYGVQTQNPYGMQYSLPLAAPALTRVAPAIQAGTMTGQPIRPVVPDASNANNVSGGGAGKTSEANRKKKPASARLEYKRVDWVWDTTAFTWKLQDSAETADDSQYSGYIFHVRRSFDSEGKHRCTHVDIESKLLRECLQDVMGNVKGVSLVDEAPKLDPNLLFLYLEEFRAHVKQLKHAEPLGDDKQERKKNRKRLETKRSHLKLLIKYLDTDYAKIKESLYPMLESGLITFELLWALWKPNTLAFSLTYGCQEEPRVWKIEVAERHSTILKGEIYFVQGKYTEFDGKKFGHGSLFEEIPSFQGARKITSLPFYPLKYHNDEASVRKMLIERGKKFVSLSGVHYKSYAGMAFLKRRRNQVVKFNIQQSRIMVDPSIFRRINPNYNVSSVRPRDHDILSDDDLSDDEDSDEAAGCDCDSDATGVSRVKVLTNIIRDSKGHIHTVSVPEDELGSQHEKTLDSLPVKQSTEGSKPEEEDDSEKKEPLPQFTEEEYLIASPVVLGFSFAEKQWLEFAVSGVRDIKWNDKAWDSLVLEPKTKDLIQALVKSRKFNAAQTIDDVIQGKGKGLVTVLHGPPGTGKTLTAEGISELLKCPLYMASAGELGTDSRYLETELQKVLDVCHTWGAILLLDEADVLLEKRNMQDIHRNALVSIFLRQLEYFQGILFLTTNRVETFDEAFQSRIHIALKYEALDIKAKKAIFNMFIERVQAMGKLEVKPFSEEDLDGIAKHELNGREIKNVMGSAQDLAVNRGEALSIRHIRQVLEVHDKFGRDLRGGAGYEDAMRSYF